MLRESPRVRRTQRRWRLGSWSTLSRNANCSALSTVGSAPDERRRTFRPEDPVPRRRRRCLCRVPHITSEDPVSANVWFLSMRPGNLSLRKPTVMSLPRIRTVNCCQLVVSCSSLRAIAAGRGRGSRLYVPRRRCGVVTVQRAIAHLERGSYAQASNFRTRRGARTTRFPSQAAATDGPAAARRAGKGTGRVRTVGPRCRSR